MWSVDVSWIPRSGAYNTESVVGETPERRAVIAHEVPQQHGGIHIAPQRQEPGVRHALARERVPCEHGQGAKKRETLGKQKRAVGSDVSNLSRT